MRSIENRPITIENNPLEVTVPPATPRLLIVDDSELILTMLSDALSDRYEDHATARSIAEAESLLARRSFDIVVLDIRLPDGDAFRLLDTHPSLFEESSIIIMTGAGDLENAVEALRRGVEDFITKPFTTRVFRERLSAAIERWEGKVRLRHYQSHLKRLVAAMTDKLMVSDRMIESAYDETVRALGAALNLRDPETEEHCRRVSLNSIELARVMGHPEGDLTNLRWGAYLHDIGKIGVPQSILTKPGPLTSEEMEQIRMHPLLGYQMVSNIEFLKHSTDVILYHHERVDGRGYPHGLRGNQIPLAARIFSVIDTMDAMLYDRPYRRAPGYRALCDELQREVKTHFDADVVSAFLDVPQEVWRRADRKSITGGSIDGNQ